MALPLKIHHWKPCSLCCERNSVRSLWLGNQCSEVCLQPGSRSAQISYSLSIWLKHLPQCPRRRVQNLVSSSSRRPSGTEGLNLLSSRLVLHGKQPPAMPQEAFEELNSALWSGQVRKPFSEKTPAPCPQRQLGKQAITDEEKNSWAIVSRRRWLLLSGSLAGILAVPRNARGLSKLSDLADNNIATDGSSVANGTADVLGSGKPLQTENVKSWYRYRGEGFVIRVPPGYEDVLEYDEEADGSSPYGKRAKDKPFLARFASPDGDEVLSVLAKPVSQLRLSFFESADITDFGTIKEAAKEFVPAGAKIVSARIINSKASRVPRTYYMYEFLLRGVHFMLSAGVSKGRVFVLGASTPQSKWKDYGNRLQLASSTFYLP